MGSTAVNWDAIFTYINGPITVGIAAGADTFSNERFYLQTTTDYTTCASINSHGDSELVKLVTAAAAIYLCKDRSRIEDDKSVAYTGAAQVDFTLPMNVNHVQAALTIIFASKINWWQTNHHTGTPKPTGFFLKVCEHYKVDLNNDTDYQAIWAMCHWADTRSVLASMGFPGIHTPKRSAWPSISDDMRIRLTSLPAGTAMVHLTFVGIQRALNGTYAFAVSQKVADELKSLSVQMAAIKKHPARFHVGARYLTGQPRILVEEPSDDAKMVAKVYITEVEKGSSLSKSPVWKKVNVEASVSEAFMNLKRQMFDADTKASAALKEEIARRTSVRAVASVIAVKDDDITAYVAAHIEPEVAPAAPL